MRGPAALQPLSPACASTWEHSLFFVLLRFLAFSETEVMPSSPVKALWINLGTKGGSKSIMAFLIYTDLQTAS